MHRVHITCDTSASAVTLTLPPDRAHYVTKVLRLRAGEQVEAFNGQGLRWRAEVVKASTKECIIRLLESLDTPPRSQPPVHLVLGLLKGEAMDRAIQRAAETGFSHIHPVYTARVNVKLDAERANSRLSHWERILISACEQCGLNQLPVLAAPVDMKTLLHTGVSGSRYVLQPGAPGFPQHAPLLETWLCIGPEGGFTEEELEWLEQAGFNATGLGDLTLRAETAPVAAIIALQQSWGWPPLSGSKDPAL